MKRVFVIFRSTHIVLSSVVDRILSRLFSSEPRFKLFFFLVVVCQIHTMSKNILDKRLCPSDGSVCVFVVLQLLYDMCVCFVRTLLDRTVESCCYNHGCNSVCSRKAA